MCQNSNYELKNNYEMMHDDHTLVSAISQEDQCGTLSSSTLPVPSEVICCTKSKKSIPSSYGYSQVSSPSSVVVDQPTFCRNISSPESQQEIQKPIMIERSFSCPADLQDLYNITRTDSRGSKCSVPEDCVYANNFDFGKQQRDNIVSFFHDNRLIGNRKRRTYRQTNNEVEIKLGSLVGESELIKDYDLPLTVVDEDEAFLRTTQARRSASVPKEQLLYTTGAADGIGCCEMRHSTSIIKKELKYMANKVILPVKTLPIFREKKTEFHRANGRLV